MRPSAPSGSCSLFGRADLAPIRAGADDRGRPARDEDLRGTPVTEERSGARGQSVGPRLKNTDQISYFGRRKPNLSRQSVERRAQRANNVNHLARGLIDTVENRNRKVSLDHLTEIARRREMMIHPSIGDQERLAA